MRKLILLKTKEDIVTYLFNILFIKVYKKCIKMKDTTFGKNIRLLDSYIFT